MAGFFSEVTAKLGIDITAFKRGMTEATSVAGKTAGEISKKFEARDIGRTLATALGVNLQSIAENLARAITGMSKEEEEALKRIEEKSTQVADANIARMRARLTGEQQLTLVIAERERLERQIDDLSSKANMTTAERESLLQKQLDVEKLVSEEKRIQLKVSQEEIDAAERKAKQFNDDQKSFEDYVAARQKSVDDEKQAILDIQNSREKEADALRELAAFEREQAREKMTGEERILDLTREQREVESEIAKLTKFQSEGGQLTADGAGELLGLKKQLAELQSRIADETERETQAQKDTTEAAKETAAVLAGIAGIRTSAQFGGASTQALETLLSQQKSKVVKFGPAYNPDFNNPLSASGIADRIEIARLKSEIANIDKELSFRRNLQSDFELGGIQRARENFRGDPLQFDRVFQQLVQDNRDQKEILAQIATNTNPLQMQKYAQRVIVG